MKEPRLLVIGAGMAGLTFALKASTQGDVLVLSKDIASISNSSLAQGGIAAVLSPSDSYKMHIEDTLRAGMGLCNREAVESLVQNGPNQIRWLMEQGVDFDREDDDLDLTREGAHNRRRVVHVKDRTGEAVQTTLLNRTIDNPHIKIWENAIAVDLLMKKGRCVGASILDDSSGIVYEVRSPLTVLASGGAGQLYFKTSNSYIATGDGVALAWRAGAEVTDMEFIQFHPTTLNLGDSPYFLISESIRGEEGVLVNNMGEAFMTRKHPLKDLAPRDVVTRAIVEEQEHSEVYIDIRHRGADYLKTRFPTIYQECLSHGLYMESDLIPVTPAAHYMCGGVRANINGETSIPGLLALGECSCTGIHGSNRLASNSTLECLVSSELAFQNMKQYLIDGESNIIQVDKRRAKRSSPNPRLALQKLMWDRVGILRDGERLSVAHNELEELESHLISEMTRCSIEVKNMVDVSLLILNSSFIRHESRGTHYRLDYPMRDDAWLKHIVIRGEEIRTEK